MAGDNTVSVEFIADSSQLVSSIDKSAAAMAAWRAAADFKPATAEMRAASVAAEDLGKKGASGMAAFRGTMRALRFDIFEVVAVLGLMVKAVDEAGKAEASSRHLDNMGEGDKTLALGSAAANERFEPAQYYDAAKALKVAGVASNDLVGDVTELGKASRISGVPFEKLVDTAASMTDELESGGIPTLAQMTELTMASSGATQWMTDKYRELGKELKLTEQAWKLEEEAQARNHKQTQEQTSAADSFADKIGLSGKVFEAFKARSSYAPGMGEGMMSGELGKQYSEGLSQLGKESGMSTEKIREYMAAGKVGYEDLISASGRYRTHQQEELTFTQKQRDETKRLDTEAKERALGLSALQSVMSESDWKDKQADLQKASPQGVEQAMQAELTKAMIALGKAITQYFPEIKAAMLVLAGVEIASRLAALNARFFPNLFKGGGGAAAGAAGAAEGTTAGAATGGIPWAAAAADVVIPLLMTGDSSSKGKRWSQSEGRWLSEAEQKYGTAGAPSPVLAKPAGSGGPVAVEDPKMQDLIGRLLQVFAGGAA